MSLDMNVGYEWFAEIKHDILKKYHVKAPIFKLNNRNEKYQDHLFIVTWIDTVISQQERWVKYKHFKDNVFILKSFYPDVPDEACFKTIDTFFKSFYQPHFLKCYPNFPMNEQNIYYQLGDTIYTRIQIEKEMFYFLKTGSSEIVTTGEEVIIDPNPSKNRFIIKILFQENEMYYRINNGLLNFEYKD